MTSSHDVTHAGRGAIGIIHRKYRYLVTFGLRSMAGCLERRPQSLAPSRPRTAARRGRREAVLRLGQYTYLRVPHLHPYRAPFTALSLFRSSIDRFRVRTEHGPTSYSGKSSCTRVVRWMTSVNSPRPPAARRAQCPRRGRNGRTRTPMEDGKCPTCEALGRRSLSSKLLQVATAQAHLRTCSSAATTPEQAHDTDLASRALAAKRRKSIAGLKLSLPTDVQPKTTTAEQSRSPFGRRNTWCS